MVAARSFEWQIRCRRCSCWPRCCGAAHPGNVDVHVRYLHRQDMLLALLAEDQPLHLAGLGEPATSLIDRMPRVCDTSVHFQCPYVTGCYTG